MASLRWAGQPADVRHSSMDDLWFFQVVASNETLTAASRELGCSLSAVSKRLSALERRLDARLVQRGARRLVLTSEGERYAARSQAILDQVRDLEDSLADQSADLRGLLVVEATLGLGRAHVAPLLGEFGAAHPHLRVRLQTSELPLRPHRRTFDVAVHVGMPPDSSLRMRRLAANRRVPCAAPSYLAERGVPESIDDLARHNCIVLREKESDYALWRFGDTAHPRQMRVHGSLASNDGYVVTDWALQGRGVIMRSEWHVRPYLERGDLVRVLPHIPTPAADIYALHGGDEHLSQRAAQFIDHLSAGLSKRLSSVDPPH
ncbi:DNA-binding transcriptional LysR family regulator [Streptomyces sp. SAI-135]|uniref:LysR family transcriptional regulator n=1 Tax=unclassified Streptomyces TaxID=2593676 RepID=UPI0024758484|nr:MULTISPECIES: LysR family transcriptional regulator [unclassified Streptomyces]MDH6522919.1 DNA-binding transcriptional LysR family regulator [Streptomyces sp. SAI-090]MDH6554540.1 DNA-binding transcriptional LysR family regulator [Streptomyces sp. SAI-041]MDH6573806.1 DNA-binding transcriptional LysR family regulator [Streptomyces sp. SAI-117]MDH6581463.1 DNA-binding transcriptional LysR family regulator [Streptomyces sp. SAI-133]MDH6613467.1 DNA-binding transcriptional LysR family regulat